MSAGQHRDSLFCSQEKFCNKATLRPRMRDPNVADRIRTKSVRVGFDKKKGQSVTAKALISLSFLVGGAGFEPATPAV